jgi:hypothetical protein
MNNYCGSQNNLTIPYEIALSDVNGNYGTANIFCEWTVINNQPSNYVFVNLTSNVS